MNVFSTDSVIKNPTEYVKEIFDIGFEDVHFVWELGWVGGEGLTKTDNGDGTLW